MNEFSILCRVLGSLYYRQPQDPLLVPLFTLIREGKLAASWPLEQDELLARLQKSCEMQSLATDYNALFVGEACSVPPYRSAWVEGSSEAEVRAFLSEHGIPTGEGPADHLGSLLLAVLLCVTSFAQPAYITYRVMRMLGRILMLTVRGITFSLFAFGAVTMIAEWKRIAGPAWKKVLYTFTFPFFMLTYVPISIAALVGKVEWKPIQHGIAKVQEERESA